MIFGGWRGILSGEEDRKNLTPRTQGGHRGHTERKSNAETLKTQRCAERLSRAGVLAQVGDFLIEVGEGGFEGFAVIRVGRQLEIINDANARQLQVFDVLFPQLFLRTFRLVSGRPLLAFGGFDLRFDVFTFPASRHTSIVT